MDIEWIEVPLPKSMASGPATQILHYLKVNEDWAVYIVELEDSEESEMFMAPGGPVAGRAKWMIIFKDGDVAHGVLNNIKSAKNVSMTVLNSLMEGPEPDVVNPSGGFIMGLGGKGSGN